MNDYRDISSAFQALADPTRLRLLSLVAEANPCANDLNRALGMSQPRVARHLKILVEAGLLEAQRDGRFIRYSLPETGWASRLAALALDLAPPAEANPLTRRRPPADRRRPGPRRPVEAPEAATPESDEEPPRAGNMEDFLL